MKITPIICLLGVLFLGCHDGCGPDPKTPDNLLKKEEAEVVQMAYIPATDSDGGGVSVDSGGHIGVVMGGGSSAEVWAVVFRCKDHGKTFSIRSKEVYEKCSTGKHVILYYRDILQCGEVVSQKTERVEVF